MVKPHERGKYRWAQEKKDGSVLAKYNADDTKNLYHWRDEQGVLYTMDRANLTSWGVTDAKGKAAAVLDVPEGAQVFQRRRVIDINYFNRFHDVHVKIGGKVVGGKYLPERVVTRRYPEHTYGECWLLGYRVRKPNGQLEVKGKVVYPDGKVEDFTKFGQKPWLGEPDWFEEELVDDEDKALQSERLAKKYRRSKDQELTLRGWHV